MSQEKLAELADLNRNFVGMIERGETNLTVKKLENIANVFDIDIMDLFSFVIYPLWHKDFLVEYSPFASENIFLHVFVPSLAIKHSYPIGQ